MRTKCSNELIVFKFRPRRYRWQVIATVILLGSVGCGKAEPPQARPPEVEVVQVEQKDVPIWNEWVGTLEGLVNAQIKPQVLGYLLRQTYKEGSFVRKGQLLFEIDPRTFQAALDQTRAQLANANGQLAQAEANQVKAQLDAARAQVDAAQLNLGFTRIVSLIDGIVGIAQAQIGDLVGPSSLLTTVSTLDPIKVYFPVSEKGYLNYIKENPDAAKRAEQERQLGLEMILADGSRYPHEGSFSFADRQVDVKTGTLRLQGLFPNPGNILRPGQFARVRAVTKTRRGALLVPQRAVTELQGSYQVAVVGKDNKVSIRPVKVGERTGSQWVVDAGLKPGERVIAEGIQRVRQGMTVNPKPLKAETEAKPAPTAKSEPR